MTSPCVTFWAIFCYKSISPHLAKMMIELGPCATAMRDRKGWLPAHVACSRHCSPHKLKMLLAAYPAALHAETDDGNTLLSLATSTATTSHPNFALIEMLRAEMDKFPKYLRQGSNVFTDVMVGPNLSTARILNQGLRGHFLDGKHPLEPNRVEPNVKQEIFKRQKREGILSLRRDIDERDKLMIHLLFYFHEHAYHNSESRNDIDCV
mmetsp:Transcript_24119/g.32110  ORF Transcript_24119/g.32110 Transcript_24119/m.32110 type:complete len:208 (+) Transcript_24119:239-862(+)